MSVPVIDLEPAIELIALAVVVHDVALLLSVFELALVNLPVVVGYFTYPIENALQEIAFINVPARL